MQHNIQNIELCPESIVELPDGSFLEGIITHCDLSTGEHIITDSSCDEVFRFYDEDCYIT